MQIPSEKKYICQIQTALSRIHSHICEYTIHEEEGTLSDECEVCRKSTPAHH